MTRTSHGRLESAWIGQRRNKSAVRYSSFVSVRLESIWVILKIACLDSTRMSRANWAKPAKSAILDWHSQPVAGRNGTQLIPVTDLRSCSLETGQYLLLTGPRKSIESSSGSSLTFADSAERSALRFIVFLLFELCLLNNTNNFLSSMAANLLSVRIEHNNNSWSFSRTIPRVVFRRPTCRFARSICPPTLTQCSTLARLMIDCSNVLRSQRHLQLLDRWNQLYF